MHYCDGLPLHSSCTGISLRLGPGRSERISCKITIALFIAKPVTDIEETSHFPCSTPEVFQEILYGMASGRPYRVSVQKQTLRICSLLGFR